MKKMTISKVVELLSAFQKRLSQVRFRPPQLLAIGFLSIIFLGAFLLMLPSATNPEYKLSFIDALFTATSAVCVTGLVVTDTASTFTVFGQVILLCLIQIGGLGFMTFGVLVALLLGKKIGFTERLLIQSSLNSLSLSGIVKLAKIILMGTLMIEGLGALLLAYFWSPEMGWDRALYYGIFHSISSFNNAGFDIMGDYRSLTGYVGNIPINLIISALFIIGGLGFTVISDVMKHHRIKHWSLHTKLVLLTTLILNLFATLGILVSEIDNPHTLQPLSWEEKLTAAYFHGTSPRTAGYNTLDMTQLQSESILITMGLMLVGGSSGSTAGGIKITTFVLLLLVAWVFLRQREEISIFKRRIPQELVFKALAISILSILFIFLAVMCLDFTEAGTSLMYLAFEAVSAFGTVGLSLGVTPGLSDYGKCIIMVLMFIGRLGPLTIAFALTNQKQHEKFKYAEEKILIG
jgi:trk system potassium uptake protein TrkH